MASGIARRAGDVVEVADGTYGAASVMVQTTVLALARSPPSARTAGPNQHPGPGLIGRSADVSPAARPSDGFLTLRLRALKSSLASAHAK